MNIKILIFLIISSFTIVSISAVTPLKCYHCSNWYDRCDDIDEMTVKDCYSSISDAFRTQAVCLKVIKEDENGMLRTYRDCAVEGNMINPCASFIVNKHCSTCMTDYCNNSMKISSSFWISIVCLISLILSQIISI